MTKSFYINKKIFFLNILAPLLACSIAWTFENPPNESNCPNLTNRNSISDTSKDILAFIKPLPVADSLQEYQNQASVISQRALMILISKPKNQRVYELYDKSDAFRDLDKLEDDELKELEMKYTRKSSHDCFKFFKGILSGDFKSLKTRVQKSGGARWNSTFLKSNMADIEDTGISEPYWDGLPAKEGGEHLQNQRWVNLFDNPTWKEKLIADPKNAPKYTALVYDDGSPNGHIEFKLTKAGRGGFGSDYFSTNPPGDNYRLIGAYYRPPTQMALNK